MAHINHTECIAELQWHLTILSVHHPHHPCIARGHGAVLAGVRVERRVDGLGDLAHRRRSHPLFGWFGGRLRSLGIWFWDNHTPITKVLILSQVI